MHELPVSPTEEFLTRVTEHVTQFLVDELPFAVCVRTHNAHCRLLEHDAQLSVALSERCLHQAALRDVLVDAYEVERLAGVVAHQ